MAKRVFIKFIIAVITFSCLAIIFWKFFPSIWGEILYPLDYENYIVKYSQEYSLDPFFVAGVIYAESHYNKDAVSRVGARGLMQIMPATGKSIATKLGENDYNADKLMDPETNIRYGCWYLRYLLDNYGGDQNAALAGYNGGGAVGDRYVVSRDAAIPKETSGFIKTVNFAQGMYQNLYKDKLSSSSVQNTTTENVVEKLTIQKEQKVSWFEQILNYLKSLRK